MGCRSMGELTGAYWDGYNYAFDVSMELIDEQLKKVHPSDKRTIDMLLDLRIEMKEAQV